MKRFSKSIMTIMLAVMVCFVAAGCTKHNGGNGAYKGHDYVDLELPSGTMWATCNVGAESPDQYGDYFAWGETTPKATYNWSTYKYCKGDYNMLTKYCSESDFGFNGFTDDLVTLQPNDDAATANWGEGWSTPTYNQWVELLRKCTHSWTTINGVKGCLFTARNGNSIFLPAGDSSSTTKAPIGQVRSTSPLLTVSKASNSSLVLRTATYTTPLVGHTVGRSERCAPLVRTKLF